MRITTAPVAFLVFLAVLLDTTGSLAQTQTASGGLPPANYRQLIAAYVSADDRYVVRDAKISKPFERWGGLLRGGTMTVICVAVFRDNPFGIVVRDNWAFRFEDGNIKPTELGMSSCSDLSHFLN
jgi:hypothetical protein